MIWGRQPATVIARRSARSTGEIDRHLHERQRRELIKAWGIAPGSCSEAEPALKARLNGSVESRFQRWRFDVTQKPGALPQASNECRAVGALGFAECHDNSPPKRISL